MRDQWCWQKGCAKSNNAPHLNSRSGYKCTVCVVYIYTLCISNLNNGPDLGFIKAAIRFDFSNCNFAVAAHARSPPPPKISHFALYEFHIMYGDVRLKKWHAAGALHSLTRKLIKLVNGAVCAAAGQIAAEDNERRRAVFEMD
jgi:hypothetical protein